MTPGFRVLPALCLLAGCANGVSTNPQPELDPFRPVLLIVAVDVTCDDGGNGSSETWEDPDDVLTVFLRNELWADRVEVRMLDTQAAETSLEEKRMPETALINADAGGSWDEWEMAYTEVATAAEVGSTTTQLNCARATRDVDGHLERLAVRIDVFEEGATEAADCVVLGPRSYELLGPECACAEEWSATPPLNPCG